MKYLWQLGIIDRVGRQIRLVSNRKRNYESSVAALLVQFCLQPNELSELVSFVEKAVVVLLDYKICVKAFITMIRASRPITVARKKFSMSVKLFDLRTLYPWDRGRVLKAIFETGRATVEHKSMDSAETGPMLPLRYRMEYFIDWKFQW